MLGELNKKGLRVKGKCRRLKKKTDQRTLNTEKGERTKKNETKKTKIKKKKKKVKDERKDKDQLHK